MVAAAFAVNSVGRTLRKSACRLIPNRTVYFVPNQFAASFISTHVVKMNEETKPPYYSQDLLETASLIKGLEGSTQKSGKGVHCKKSNFPIENSKGLSVDSWRFQDWDYKRRDLPTYARGLFTYRRKDGTPEIAIRGYDKFFNVGEVHETQWETVQQRTKGPYELSVKENGCIIFISGIEGDKLLVCSKHSTGPRKDADLSHAVAGEKAVDEQLVAVGKTRSDLARELRKRNATAVAELCDDSFEEHVLAYEKKDAGLYLHGININLPGFVTYPGKLVHIFADEWGFKKADYLMKDDIDTVKAFLEDCAQTGSYNGRDTEGFVIRCQRKLHNSDASENWFFKYKFEEPYLMYRQWREVTKAIISGKPPKYKKHKKITEEYLLYARQQLAKNPKIGEAFNANHGIIAMREGFLKERGLKGSDIIRQEQNEDNNSEDIVRNLVLVPVASIGCGKTTLAIALAKLFDWGHVQNDNITGKPNRPKQFAIQVCNSLASYPAMIADRNNHQKRERKQIMDDVQAVVPDVQFVALHYVHDPKSEMLDSIRKVTQERVLARGDNHQTIQAGSKSPQIIISIMEGFLHRFEPVNHLEEPDNGFDGVIHLEVAASSRKNLETVISYLHKSYPKIVKEMPSSSDMDNAIESALKDYQPDIKHDLSFKSDKSKPKNNTKQNASSESSTQKPPEPEYFCIRLPNNRVRSTLSNLFDPLPPESSKFYQFLQKSHRIQPSFHVTLIHRASISESPNLWSKLSSLHIAASSTSTSTTSTPTTNLDPLLGNCRVQLERVIWDHRVMCIVPRILDPGWECANSVAHVTIGTALPDIKPKESNALLSKWLEGGSGGETGIGEKEIVGNVVLKGEVRAVFRR